MIETETVFEVIEHYLQHPDLNGNRTFGIKAYILTPDGPTEVETVDDISSDRSRVAAFAEWCMRGGIHPIHLRGLAEDEFDLE